MVEGLAFYLADVKVVWKVFGTVAELVFEMVDALADQMDGSLADLMAALKEY